MKKYATCAAVSIALLGAQAAQATTYTPGTHTFSGLVTVQKDVSAYSCTLNVTVSATPSSATATMGFTGGFPCRVILVTGTGTVSVTGNNVTLTGLVVDWTFGGSGVCNGPITVVWGGNTATPRNLTTSSPLSNQSATAGAPCKMVGTINQTSAPPLDIN